MTKADIKKLDYTLEEEAGIRDEVMNIIARTEEGERVHIQNDEVDSYFYVPSEQVDHQLKNDDRVLGFEHGHESVKGKELTRIYTYIPSQVPKLREDYDHYEADILFPNRFSLDTSVYGSIEIPDEHATNEPTEVSLSDIEKAEVVTDTRVMYCDIEVDDEDGFPDEEDGDEEIVSISFYDSFEDTYYAYLYDEDKPDVTVNAEYVDDVKVAVYKSEVEMLESFAMKVNQIQPDVMAGWNFKKFDAMYLISRFDTLPQLDENDLSPLGSAYNDGWYGGKIKGIAVFDMLKAYKNLQFTELDSFGLEDVASEELGIGKLNEEDKRIHEMWHTDNDELLEYNIRDVYLTVELEKAQDIIGFYEEVANFVGGRLTEVIDYSKAADIYVLRVVNDMFAVPSMDTVSAKNDEEEFEGAEVFDPISEIKDMVSVLDLKSLYPMSMKTINAGPRTKDPDGEITAPNGVSFTKEKKSVISDIIDNLLEEREVKKEQRDQYDPDTDLYSKYDAQQRAVKVIMNTLYGVLGWDRFRLYDEDVAAAVTATGREVIKYTQREVNRLGYDVIYGDTDSVMVEFSNADSIREVIERGYIMEEEINEGYDDFAFEELNVKEHYFEIEFEKIYRRFMQAGKKKRYAGHIVWKEGKETDQTDIVGFEWQRSDYSAVAKNLQKKMIEAILMGAEKKEVSDMVIDSIENIKNLEYDLDDLGIPGGIGQAFHKYDNKTKQVRGSEYANEYFGEEIQPGDKPKGIYVRKIVWDDPDKPQPPQMKDSAYICWMNSNNVPDSAVFDWDKYIDIQIEGPLSRIIECTEWMWDEIVTGQDQTALDGFDTGEEATEDDIFGDDIQSKTQSNEETALDQFDTGEEETFDDEFEDTEEETEEKMGIETLSKEEIIEAANGETEEKEEQPGLSAFE